MLDGAGRKTLRPLRHVQLQRVLIAPRGNELPRDFLKGLLRAQTRSVWWLGALTTTLMCVFSVGGQEKANSSQQRQLLVTNPEIVQIGLAPITSKRSSTDHPRVNASERYKAGQKVKFHLVMTNTALFAVRILTLDTYAQNRPILHRDGQQLPYREEIENVLPATENLTDFLRTDSFLLEPNSPKPLEVITLADWYEPLKPGHYNLLVRHRFQLGGKWTESSPITFEVDPE